MSAPGFLENTGPMGDIYRAKDWSTCPLGAPETWSDALKGYVDMMMRMPTGTIIFWGPDQIQLYNLRYADIMGPRHPKYLGAPYRECWPDTYPTIYPWMRRVLDDGEVIEVDNALIPVTRYGFNEETYFTFSFVPLRNDKGEIEGFIQHINETTRTLLAERRLATLRGLAPRVKGQASAIDDATAAFAGNPQDIPFAVVWIPDADGALRVATRVNVDGSIDTLSSLAADVLAAGAVRDVEDIAPYLGDRVLGPWPEPTKRMRLVPLSRAGTDDARGVIAFGVSSRLSLDETYTTFFDSAARELASNLAFEHENREKARLNEELERRAEALTVLDRAKTAFFSNVSHEFRTPLTLMLGPIEDALGDNEDPLGDKQRARLALVEKNGQRLFKLVNTLLDFSRIEAGRTTATFAPTDLAKLTTDLASSFRSLLERAGLSLTVHCAPTSEPVWVDREMWEKIVLNLLSNAFKFTFTGGIRVALAQRDGRAELRVQDSGTGIPPGELDKLFDRFHRVEGAKGRSFEGSGIGLALVQELARLMSGDIRVESELGKGSTFIVTLPLGKEHVPADRIARTDDEQQSAAADAFLREAEGWGVRAETPVEDIGDPVPSGQRPRILLADDNADMRDYVRRLLETRFDIDAVPNGRLALESIRANRPALVLSDVMMPELDGFGLLAAIRADVDLRTLPVILLSARAGEEARVEGMEAGADDYLVKPFAARELIARVGARLEIARMQDEMSEQLERLVLERTAQLREANRELESFSYSVSHDLRAPLRHILGFSQLLEKSSGGDLDAKSANYLKVISEAARRGGQLVDDLLGFSRLGRSEVKKSRVELGRMALDVKMELQPEQEGRTVQWKIHDLPDVQGDPSLLRLVLRNLMSNALKYSRKRPESIIEIGASETPREVAIWVKDNGVGFDMRYVDKLFGVFQRLHTNEEFEGTGIGLALVRRIVGRHGGTTRAEGALDAGATITFTLPKPL